MTDSHSELRQDLTAVLQARSELPDHEEYLAEQFLARLERSIDRSLAARLSAHDPVRRPESIITGVERAVLAIPFLVILLVALSIGPDHFAEAFLLMSVVMITTALCVGHVSWHVARRYRAKHG